MPIRMVGITDVVQCRTAFIIDRDSRSMDQRGATMPATLDIGALRSLVAIADSGGFHRASTALRISQSAISQHVRKLEAVLGRPVVERHGRATRFTSDGEAL